MIATRPDWCISRQRVWGVPITVFYCEQCGEPLTDRKIPRPDRASHSPSTPPTSGTPAAPPNCSAPRPRARNAAAREFRKENDILDVWFDSGSSHLAVLTRRTACPGPPTCISKAATSTAAGSTSSLLVGVGLRGASPYRECATNGWQLDGEGRAMSKSLGNVIEPEQIIKQYGADVLRLWVASVDFHEDVRFSETDHHPPHGGLPQAAQHLPLRPRQPARFRPGADALPAAGCSKIDRGCCIRAEALAAQCRAWYDELAFHHVYQALYNFATTDLSSVYFDVLKDRLYTSPAPLARPPQRADGAVSHPLRAGAAGRSAAGLHGRGGVGRACACPRARPPASTSPSCPDRAS